MTTNFSAKCESGSYLTEIDVRYATNTSLRETYNETDLNCSSEYNVTWNETDPENDTQNITKNATYIVPHNYTLTIKCCPLPALEAFVPNYEILHLNMSTVFLDMN